MNIMEGLKKALSRRDFMKTTAVGLGVTALSRLGAEAAEPLEQPIMIFRAPEGETKCVALNKIVGGKTMYYFPYIYGYDGSCFSDATKNDETTAYFTGGVTGSSTTKAFRMGNVSCDVRSGGVVFAMYFNPTPHGNYAQPETFFDGIKIVEAVFLPGSQNLIKYPTVGTLREFTLYSHSLMQTYAGIFTFGGKEYTVGSVGDRWQTNMLGAPNPSDTAISDIVGRWISTRPA
jgi:hypothetical protein